MKSSSFTFDARDGTRIFAYKWEPEGAARALVLIVHGTGDHALRYEHVASRFAGAGYACYACDLRGHGKTAADRPGFVCPEAWESTIDDLGRLAGIAAKERPGLPVFLVGHSTGSLFAQDFMQRGSRELAGVVMSGSVGHQPFLVQGAGALLARTMIVLHGPDAPSDLAYNLTFKAYNKKYTPSPTLSDFDWLSRDQALSKKYAQDPLCGFKISNRLALEYVLGMRRIWKPENEARIPKNLPLLFVSGTDDQYSSSLKELKPLVERYKARGMTDVTARYYEGARHEVFNETNKDEVLGDVLAWLEARTPARS